MASPEDKAGVAAVVAVEKTAAAQEAVEASRKAQNEASDAKHLDMMIQALKEVFPEASHLPDDQMKIFLPRVPLICAQVTSMKISIEKIEDNLSKAVWLVLSAVILGVLAMLFKQ